MSGGEWREIRPRLGRRIDGLVEVTPVLDPGTRLLGTDGGLRLAAPGVRWGYVARFRLKAGVVSPSQWTAPIVLRVTATALQGRIGAVCVADELATVLSNSVEWTEDDGQVTLDLVLYTYPGQGWLVFRNTAAPSPEVAFRVTAVEAFTLEQVPPAPDAGSRAGTGRTVIFTGITNHYDTLRPVPHPEPDCDYVCFTDDPESIPPPWTPVRIGRRFRDPRLDALWYRVHPHVSFPDHDVSIYFDGRFELRRDIVPLARGTLADVSLAVFDNPWRDCTYLAAGDDVRMGRDASPVVEVQLERYRQAGFPRHLACLPPGFLIRRHHDPDIVRMGTAWWEEIVGASYRDEISFTYVIWNLRLPFRRVWLPVHDNPYAKLGEHNFVDFYRT